ncbi:MAG TPA: toll/interleukin-1 receptor domain-containing protein [Pyrinomonadaceae bacterium]
MTQVSQVFLSHSSKDKPQVRRLAKELMQSGISVWFDEAEIKVGDSILQKINQALLYSDYVIAILSNNSVSSRWVQEELQTAFIKNAKGAQSIIIPVLLDQIDFEKIPPFFRDIKWVDLSKNYEQGLQELIQAIVKRPKEGSAKFAINTLIDTGDLAKEVAREVMQVLRADPQGIRLPDWSPDPELVFVIISFTPDMEPIFDGIKAAGVKHKLRVERVKDVPGDYRITDKVVQMIHGARIIVADLSHERPNVYFELGYARGLGKTVITIAREDTKLHFDVKDWTCFFYNDSRVVERYLDERFAYELGKDASED